MGVGAYVAKNSAANAATGSIRKEVVLSTGEIGDVVRVLDGDSFILSNGLNVKLAAIQVPQMAWPDKDIEAQPLAEEAAGELSRLIDGQKVQLFYGGDPRDRYDRAAAQVWVLGADGEKQFWVQEALLSAGYARVYTWPNHAQDTQALYQAEQSARRANKGMWNTDVSGDAYSIRRPDPDPLAQYVDSIQIVEGIVTSTADVQGTIYLNFGADYKTDFTVGISRSHKKGFEAEGMDILSLRGARIRVRGWLELQNGPVIWLRDPNRLEILD